MLRSINVEGKMTLETLSMQSALSRFFFITSLGSFLDPGGAAAAAGWLLPLLLLLLLLLPLPPSVAPLPDLPDGPPLPPPPPPAAAAAPAAADDAGRSSPAPTPPPPPPSPLLSPPCLGQGSLKLKWIASSWRNKVGMEIMHGGKKGRKTEPFFESKKGQNLSEDTFDFSKTTYFLKNYNFCQNCKMSEMLLEYGAVKMDSVRGCMKSRCKYH